ncbi:MAG: hypothetical protein V9E94_02010 [Microthrixaceae bacterium]
MQLEPGCFALGLRLSASSADPWAPGAASTLLERALAETRLQVDRGRRP